MNRQQSEHTKSTNVAVITGGSSGIGYATTRRLQQAGYTVAVIDIASADGSADLSRIADVTSESDVTEAIKSILHETRRIDLLVNNAGVTGSAEATTCHQTSVADWDLVHAVNVRGPFLCSRAVLPSMIEHGSGHIITVASIASTVAFPGRCAYTSSKGAALQLMRSIALDYAPQGIRANAVCPGMVETPMTQWRLDQPDLREEVESKIPLGRVAETEEIADVITSLASSSFTYMTGQALIFDGGWTAQ